MILDCVHVYLLSFLLFTIVYSHFDELPQMAASYLSERRYRSVQVHVDVI